MRREALLTVLLAVLAPPAEPTANQLAFFEK